MRLRTVEVIIVAIATGAIFSTAWLIFKDIPIYAPTITVIKKTEDNTQLKNELAWYKEQTTRVFGKGFKPGNLMSTTINLSSYNPLEEQCDSTPLIASDNGLVAPGILALPKHWREALGFDLGKLVWIPPYGQFIVRDHMNSRKKVGRGDIISLIPGWSKKFGINNMATMYWVAEEVK